MGKILDTRSKNLAGKKKKTLSEGWLEAAPKCTLVELFKMSVKQGLSGLFSEGAVSGGINGECWARGEIMWKTGCLGKAVLKSWSINSYTLLQSLRILLYCRSSSFYGSGDPLILVSNRTLFTKNKFRYTYKKKICSFGRQSEQEQVRKREV